MILGWHQSHSLAENAPSNGIEPAPHPVVHGTIFTGCSNTCIVLIGKDFCENRNASISFPCALLIYLWLSPSDLLFFSVRVSSLSVIHTSVLSYFTLYIYINNLREKFSPGLGFEPGSPALRAGALPAGPHRRTPGPSYKMFSYTIPHFLFQLKFITYTRSLSKL